MPSCLSCNHKARKHCPLQRRVLFVPETQEAMIRGFCSQWQPIRSV